ncbi:ESX secretion-associated protein EspG [Labedaea rhizosphaerae]|uniref:ESAT-6 protein secretion system EspG family protein n=1 Tax=Labedaea rhizosphaerae TaxID=598644 RepID=A0A4R6S641_LABRH|nr:ESX secretion-associated protein EspG [Labedaea rhizosphaerae]TDP94774.1 ESAT-6 protein secretion system EspG family protein [Labedaea rhizosphaerae]
MTEEAATPEPPADQGVHFGLVELDLLATHAGTRFPFPLRVPEFGRIEGERQILLAAAGVTLRARGLAGERGPLGLAAEVVTALREYRGSVDLVLVDPGLTVGVVAMIYRSWTLLCRQPLTGDLSTNPATNGVRIQRVAQSALTDELFEMVPDIESAIAMPITLSPQDADSAVIEDLGRIIPELNGTGQLGASRRGAGRIGTDLSWVDGPRGRVRVNRGADGWISVNALRQDEIRHAIDELAMSARREDDGSTRVAGAV